MIQLQIEGQFLDMNPDTALNISVNSPFFSTDTIAGSTVYDFEIPFSDHNNRLLRYSGVESVSTITGSYPVIVYYNGSPFKEGILYKDRRAAHGNLFQPSYLPGNNDV